MDKGKKEKSITAFIEWRKKVHEKQGLIIENQSAMGIYAPESLNCCLVTGNRWR